jgi:thioredoxin:protein disulfide reductase
VRAFEAGSVRCGDEAGVNDALIAGHHDRKTVPNTLPPRSPVPARALRAAGVAVGLALTLPATPAPAAERFLKPEQAFALAVTARHGQPVRLQWTIAPGYYLYRDRIVIIAMPGGTPVQAPLPPGRPKVDPNFGSVSVYHQGVTVEVSAAGATSLVVKWQGCAEGGVCYLPQTRTIALAPGAGAAAAR